MSTLISFDVDGTLIHSVGLEANKLHKQAFAYAWKSVLNLDADIEAIPHHGMTDPLILICITEHYGLSHEKAMEKLPEMKAAMVEYYMQFESSAGDGIELLPGVLELLTALQARGDVLVCLVTGNLEPIGWSKMAALGVLGLFSQPNFGGFGSDYCSGNTTESWRDRAELVRIAGKRGAEICPDRITARFHVGDTPMDLLAAAEAGAQAVGVTTGVFTQQQLLASNVDAHLLPDLTDLARVLEVFNLQ